MHRSCHPKAWFAHLLSCVCLGVLLLPVPLFCQPGALDPAFAPQLSPGAVVYAVALQADGKILIGGDFDTVDGEARANLARLHPDGSLDTSFDPAQAADLGYVSAITIQPNGKILIGGAFYSSSYSNPNNIARLNPDGSPDPYFDPSLFVDGPINAIAVQEEGFLIIAGSFEYVNGFSRRYVARLYPDGTLEYSFDACVAASSGSGATSVTLLPDGKILTTGRFIFANDVYRDGVARLLDCGDVDLTYAPQPGMNDGATAYALAVDANGNAYVVGDFVLYNNLVRPGILQLDTNGVPIGSFNPGAGVFNNTIYTVHLQEDGKLVIGGSFQTYNWLPATNLARLFPDGSLDTTFNPGAGPNDAVSAVVFQGSKMLVAGKFSSYDSVPRAGLARILGDPMKPRLSRPVHLANEGCQFSLAGEPGQTYSIQASTNLLDWTVITNVMASDTPVAIRDSSPNSRRFYRAQQLP